MGKGESNLILLSMRIILVEDIDMQSSFRFI